MKIVRTVAVDMSLTAKFYYVLCCETSSQNYIPRHLPPPSSVSPVSHDHQLAGPGHARLRLALLDQEPCFLPGC